MAGAALLPAGSQREAQPLLRGAPPAHDPWHSFWSRNALLTALLIAATLGVLLAGMERAAEAVLGFGGGERGARVARRHRVPIARGGVLKVHAEASLHAIVADAPRKLEASGVAGAPGGYVVVMDNVWDVLRVGAGLNATEWVRWRGAGDSQFEGITFNETSGSYVVVQEAVVNERRGHVVARVWDVALGVGGARVNWVCDTEKKFSHDNKGFEGVAAVSAGGEEYLLGLCEGNHCSGGKRGRKRGHGRVVVMQRGVDAYGDCIMRTVSEIKLPKGVRFQDYSDIAVRAYEVGEDGVRVAVSSQEDSEVWVGELRHVGGDDVFRLHGGTVYPFPREDGEIVHCNIEGVHFVEDNVLATVSDAAKGHGKQPQRCFKLAQSVTVFEFDE